MQSLKNKSFTIFDFETSGLDPKKDRVIEMAAIRVVNGEVASEFSTLVKFDGKLAPKITELTGITDEMTTFGMDEDTAFRILNRMLGDHILVAHNAQFDLGFLHHSLMRIAGRSFNNDFIDTLTISRARHVYPHTLKDMCDRYNIPLIGGHRALNDVVACWELFRTMDEESPAMDALNKLGYIKKYGPPAWSPPYAKLEAIELKFAPR
ncbi:3'-5' exonuclease [Paenibacillus sp. GSMTC-2017]|uniref:3'-5' exonuclease n=1 Tax=Paenibacillus sp. GSMTC-2017 TaxID=2794350 RepID=UPI0018D973AC|nr:3'-5' exonuclease [Paenibacillus sp. GSMTC-2017]MBH5317053.1 3'-5' exonuclease [Paenibacillus sp. GSMTC-2017]